MFVYVFIFRLSITVQREREEVGIPAGSWHRDSPQPSNSPGSWARGYPVYSEEVSGLELGTLPNEAASQRAVFYLHASIWPQKLYF